MMGKPRGLPDFWINRLTCVYGRCSVLPSADVLPDAIGREDGVPAVLLLPRLRRAWAVGAQGASRLSLALMSTLTSAPRSQTIQEITVVRGLFGARAPCSPPTI